MQTLNLLELKVITLCHQYRVGPGQSAHLNFCSWPSNSIELGQTVPLIAGWPCSIRVVKAIVRDVALSIISWLLSRDRLLPEFLNTSNHQYNYMVMVRLHKNEYFTLYQLVLATYHQSDLYLLNHQSHNLRFGYIVRSLQKEGENKI